MTAPSFPLPERDWFHYDRCSVGVTGLRSACARVLEVGYSREYSEAHLVARWCLGMFHEAPVACRDCGATDWERKLHAALDWESTPVERLRIDYAGKIFSIRPDLDYIPLCIPCHRRHDTWRKALPAIAAA
jgi:hypothetical protein